MLFILLCTGRSNVFAETDFINSFVLSLLFVVIDSISPAVGSIVGGQLITITGDFFDESKAPAEVMVGNDTCTIESITDTQILCRTPAEQSGSPSSYPGTTRVQKHVDRGDYSPAPIITATEVHLDLLDHVHKVSLKYRVTNWKP